MFSGANLAYFSLGRMRLEAEVEKGNKSARKVLALRKDSNLLLCTILWGNVSVNVLLALLSDSVFAGIGGFIFSTVGITFFGEILPQAYFSRHALKVGALLYPVILMYEILLYVVAKPCSLVLDGWIGPEGPTFYRERDIEIILEKHIREIDSEISANEGRGALNFLDLDDRHIAEEGSELDPETIYSFTQNLDLPILPSVDTEAGQAWVESLKKHPCKWAIILGDRSIPHLVLNTTEYLSALFAKGEDADVYDYCHRPIVVETAEITLDHVLGDFVVEAEHINDHVVDRDVVLYWTSSKKRIITGADIFGRLLRGIARREEEVSDLVPKPT
ncbi:HlyC/CorC family transporter [Oceaniferula spumae]|uniref:HlyC/CorC family transporter n=1 Tax=Oceaniferula spumae TaxID=2979115 RepID=A0AAT9FJ04_9BACT